MDDYLSDPSPEMIQQALIARLKQYQASGLTPEGKMQPEQQGPAGPQGNDLMRGVGGLMSLLGPNNKSMGEMGQHIQDAAQTQQVFQRQTPGIQLQNEMERLKMAGAQRAESAATNPASAAAVLGVAKRYGVNLPADTPLGTAQGLLPTIEKGYGAEQGRLSRADVARLMTYQTTPPRGQGPGGPSAPDTTPPGGIGPLEPLPPAGKIADLHNKLAEGFKKDMDAASASSRSAFGQSANIIFRGARVLPLLKQTNPDGTPRMPTIPEWQDIGGALIAMQTGAAPTQEMMKEGVPRDVEGTAAGIMSWLTSDPHAPDRQAWVDRFISNINREEEQAKGFQRAAQMQRLGSNSQYFTAFPNRAKMAAKAYGIDPSLIDQVRNGTFVPPSQDNNTQTQQGPGGGTVDVINPQGVRGQIPAAKLQAALAKGYKLAGQ